MRYLIFILLILYNLSISYGQNLKYIDSLKQVVSQTKDLKIKADCYNFISKEFISNAAFDSIRFYADKAFNLSKQINYNIGIGASYSNFAAIEYDKGNSDKALELYTKALDFFKKDKSELMIARIYTSIGNIYINTGDYKKALETYLNSIKMIDILIEKDSSSLFLYETKANNLNNIGNVYFYLENYNEVLKYYIAAKDLYLKINDKLNLANSYNNIGLIYRVNGEIEKSVTYRLKAIETFKEINNIEGIAYSNLGLGNLYLANKQEAKAVEYFHEALKYYKIMDSKKGIIMIYINLSEALAKNKEFEKALDYLNKSLDLSIQCKNHDLRKDVYKTFSNVYKSMNNYKLSLEYQTLYIELKDSIFTTENQKAIAEMQTKYDTEKKEKEILLLNQDKIIREAALLKKSQEVEKQKIIIYAFILGFITIIIFSLLLYRQFRAKKIAYIKLEKQNIEIQQKNEEISSQRDEIESQRDEIMAQRDLVTLQKEEIEHIHEKVTSSIRYAERIQHAMLPTDEMSKMLLANYFILYKPRDIVSGDFYWTMIKKEWLYIAVADCTGHGVPGAFMSMLGISLLNEIIAQNEIIKANEILYKLRELIIRSLKQSSYSSTSNGQFENTSSSIKDGMDISLVVINLENYNLQFAGANNPLYLIQNDQLTEVKGDKMPIAIYERMTDYENHEIKLNRGDIFYLTTDGYADQFGGMENKKFYKKQLKDLLFSVSKSEMPEQKEILEKKIIEWKGVNDQTDDITIVGVKI